VDVVKILKEGFDSFIKDVLPLVVATLLTLLLTAITLGVLGGPLLAGLYRMVLGRLQQDRTPEIGDVFYFERFGSFVLAFYALAILVSLGYMLLIVPGLYLSTIWFYVFPLMVAEELSLSEAMAESKRRVEEIGLGPHFGLVLILAVASAAAGTLTKSLGLFVTCPFTIACSAIAYTLSTNSPVGTSEHADA